MFVRVQVQARHGHHVATIAAQEKKVYEDRYEDAKAKYDEEMKEYQSSSGRGLCGG